MRDGYRGVKRGGRGKGLVGAKGRKEGRGIEEKGSGKE